MNSSSPDNWRVVAARATLADTSVPDRVSDAIVDFLQSASRAPLKGTEFQRRGCERIGLVARRGVEARMRIDAIELEWFRGAAGPIALPVKGKSVVVYGPNGAGKSSFVDAIEYLLRDGKIGHLSHEYSGKKQEKGVINTHTPALKPTRATLQFIDGSRANANVKTNGTFSKSGDGLEHIAGLDYRSVVLRQDEVAAFISSAKGEKYSALLPLLGLEELEFAAENIRQLSKRIAKASDLDGKRRELSVATQAVKGASSIEDVQSKIVALHAKYRVSAPGEADLASRLLEDSGQHPRARSSASPRCAETRCATEFGGCSTGIVSR